MRTPFRKLLPALLFLTFSVFTSALVAQKDISFSVLSEAQVYGGRGEFSNVLLDGSPFLVYAYNPEDIEEQRWAKEIAYLSNTFNALVTIAVVQEDAPDFETLYTNKSNVTAAVSVLERGSVTLFDETGQFVKTYSGWSGLDKVKIQITKEKTLRKPKKDNNLRAKTILTGFESILKFPTVVATDASQGVLFVGDAGHNRILAFDTEGMLRDIIGSGQNGYKGGTFKKAQFNGFADMVYDEKERVLYVAEANSIVIRSIDFKTRKVDKTIIKGFSGIDGMAEKPKVLQLVDGKMYIAAANGAQIFQLDLETSTATPILGNRGKEIEEGKGLQAGVGQISTFAMDDSNFYIAQANAKGVLVVKRNKLTVEKDNLYPQRGMDEPIRDICNADGVWYCTAGNHLMQIVDEKVVKIAGKEAAYLDAKLSQAAFHMPAGLATSDGTLFVADVRNNAVREVSPAGIVSSFEFDNAGLGRAKRSFGAAETFLEAKLDKEADARFISFNVVLPNNLSFGMAQQQLVSLDPSIVAMESDPATGYFKFQILSDTNASNAEFMYDFVAQSKVNKSQRQYATGSVLVPFANNMLGQGTQRIVLDLEKIEARE